MSATRDRKGAVLIVVLVCLGVIGILVFSAMQTSLRQRRQLDREHQMEQTRLLAEAGLQHAIGRAKSGAAIEDGEIVLNPNLDATRTSKVQIETDSAGGKTKILVRASIGIKDRPELSTTQSLTQELDLPTRIGNEK